MAENALDVSKFFTKTNEEDGMWFEAKVRGVGSGIEFKVYGPNSNAATIARDNRDKATEEAEKIEDKVQKNEFEDKVMSEFAAALVCDIRGKGNFELVNKDKTPVTVKDVKEILYNSPILALEVIRFASAQNNFLSV